MNYDEALELVSDPTDSPRSSMLFFDGRPLQEVSIVRRQRCVAGEQNSGTGQTKPGVTVKEAVFGLNRPENGNKEFPSGEKEPVFGKQKPVFGEKEPVSGEKKPVFGKAEYGKFSPEYGKFSAEYVFGEKKPVFGEKIPGTGQEESSPERQQVLYPYGVGIDTHSKFIAVCVLKQQPGGNGTSDIIRHEKSFRTTWPDLLAGKRWVDSLLADVEQPDRTRYCIESTGTYHRPVIHAWKGQPFVVNPLLARGPAGLWPAALPWPWWLRLRIWWPSSTP